MSSLWNVEIRGRYNPASNCRPILWSTDSYSNVGRVYRIGSYCGPLMLQNSLVSKYRQLTISNPNPIWYNSYNSSIMYFWQFLGVSVIIRTAARYASHTQIVTCVSFHCRLLKHGMLWKQLPSIIWVWISSPMTFPLSNKCALPMKAEEGWWQSAWQYAKPMEELGANPCHF